MTDFTSILKNKLTYAYAPELISMSALAATEVTTDDTVTTYATHSANTFKGADRLKFAYTATIDNASGNNELFAHKVDIGTTVITLNATTANGETDTILFEGELIRVSSTSFLYVVEITVYADGDVTSATTSRSFGLVADSTVTEVTFTSTNDSVISAGCDLAGLGGYIIVDTFETN